MSTQFQMKIVFIQEKSYLDDGIKIIDSNTEEEKKTEKKRERENIAEGIYKCVQGSKETRENNRTKKTLTK